MAASAAWVDVSVTLRHGMAQWPGDPAVRITTLSDVRRGDRSTLSRLEMGSHAGTHMDAPRHFLRRGPGLDTMPLAAVIGPARVIEIRDPHVVTRQELRRHRARRGERLLFKTRNSRRCWRRRGFVENFVHLSTEAAVELAAIGVRTVGVDYLSVGGYHGNGLAVHRALLAAGIWIIEGLNLAPVAAGRYDLVCLPLKILDSDGAPARAALRRRAGPGAA